MCDLIKGLKGVCVREGGCRQEVRERDCVSIGTLCMGERGGVFHSCLCVQTGKEKSMNFRGKNVSHMCSA